MLFALCLDLTYKKFKNLQVKIRSAQKPYKYYTDMSHMRLLHMRFVNDWIL